MKYEMQETVRWMLDEAVRARDVERHPDARGIMRPKSKARREAERARVQVLCEVLWNADGRPGSLEEFIASHTGA